MWVLRPTNQAGRGLRQGDHGGSLAGAGRLALCCARSVGLFFYMIGLQKDLVLGGEMFNIRRRNADYYSVIAKAVSVLDRSTGDARRRVYECARRAALAELNRAYPPLDQSDILLAQMSLEAAIEMVEAEALRNRRVPSTASPRAEQRHASRTRSWGRIFRQSADRSRFRSGVSSDHSPVAPYSGNARDPWLTSLLSRASLNVEEGDQQLMRRPR
jgi:hypothetical protein